MCEVEPVAAAIGLGSNLGDSWRLLNQAIELLAAQPQMQITQVGSYYVTPPIGPPQPDYLNSAVTIQTKLSPWALLDVLQTIEQQSGRERLVHWGARTLDLDLLLYGSWQIDTPRLQVPHPLMLDRAFVLVPLAEIAGDWWCQGKQIQDWRATINDADIVVA
jgi:2-amino-4-hydroxy-6-hydroxymethyldihydropteridine diphosphokinase